MLAPDTRLGTYRIVRLLGKGGMAAVYEAVDERDAKPVALKVMDTLALARHEVRERFEREARAALSLPPHPAIVPLRDARFDVSPPFLVFELLPGGTLADLVKREGALPWRRAAAIGARIAEGLAAIHEAGLVHRDLKPANVLLDAEGRPRIGDFGLVRGDAAALGPSRLTATGEVVGTPAYLSPEQAKADGVIGPAADLYALGCTLHALLTGEPPFAGTGWGLLKQHMVETPAPPSTRTREPIPPALDALVLRLLEKDPARRGTAGAVADELGRRAPRRRAPYPEGTLAVVASFVAIAGGLSVTLGGGPRDAAPAAPPATTGTGAPPPAARARFELERAVPDTLEWRDRGGVRCVARVSEDEILTASREGSLTLWRARPESVAPIATLRTWLGDVELHADQVVADRRGRRIVVVPSGDRPAVLFDREAAKPLAFEGPRPVRQASIDASGRFLALCTGREVAIHDLDDPDRARPARVLVTERIAPFACFFGDAPHLAITAERNLIQVREPLAPADRSLAQAHAGLGVYTGIGVTGDGQAVYVASEKGGVVRWEWRSTRPPETLGAEHVTRLAVAPRSDMAAVNYADGTVGRLGPSRPRELIGEGKLRSLTFMERGRLLGVTESWKLLEWDANGKLTTDSKERLDHPTEVYGLDLSREGWVASANRDRSVTRWNIRGGLEFGGVLARVGRGRGDRNLESLAFLGDELVVAAGGASFDTPLGETKVVSDSPRTTLIARAGERLVRITNEHFITTREGRKDWRLGGDVTVLCATADGSRALAAGAGEGGGFAAIASLRGDEVADVFEVATDAGVSGAALSERGESMVLGTSDGRLAVYRIEDRTATPGPPIEAGGCVARRRVAPGTSRVVVATREDCGLRIYDTAGGRLANVQSLFLREARDPLGDVGMCILPLARDRFLVGTLRGQVRLYEERTQEGR